MVDFQYKDSYGVQDLEEIVRILRAPGGCPWDAEQTHQSIRRNFLEESYEAVEAIDARSTFRRNWGTCSFRWPSMRRWSGSWGTSI